MFWQKISYDPFQTPVYESPTPNDEEIDELATEADQAGGGGGAGIGAGQHQHGSNVTYQASSPDEVALVEWSEEMGLTLVERTLSSMKLKTPNGDIIPYSVLQIFPFTSETKRMGIIVKDEMSNEIVFYMKGADVVMSSIVQYNDWLEEEVDNMAREGLRTLVVAKKSLTHGRLMTESSSSVVWFLESKLNAVFLNGLRQWASTPTLLILTLLRMALSKVSFSDILRNDYFDTSQENIDFDTFKNDTFESVWVDAYSLSTLKNPQKWLKMKINRVQLPPNPFFG